MGKRIVPYPRINSNAALKKLGVDVVWELSCEGRKLPYQMLGECQYQITDKVWYPVSSPLKVQANGRIRNTVKLFDGVEGNGGCAIASRTSVIGLAFRWKLPKSNLQGVVHCKDITFDRSGDLVFGASLEFPPMVIRFQLEVEIVLYLKNHTSTVRDIYASTQGSLLGPIGRMVLVTGGGGGYFPTEVEEVENGQLWRVHVDIDDHEDFQEEFTASVFCLILNRLHPLYEQVYVTSKDGKVCLSPLMFEVFVNCCYVLVRKACKLLPDVSWELKAEEKDDMSVLVNFKALKRRCLNGFSRKEIIDMEPEKLMDELHKGLSACVLVDSGEEGK